MSIRKQGKTAAALVAATAILGVSASIAGAEEIDFSGVECVEHNVRIERASPPFGDLHGLVERNGICFDAEGNFTNWIMHWFTFDVVGGVTVWRGNTVVTIPPTEAQITAGDDGDKLFLDWRSAHGTEGPQSQRSTMWVTRGTGRFADATGGGDIIEYNPPNDPAGLAPDLMVMVRTTFQPGFIVTY